MFLPHDSRDENTSGMKPERDGLWPVGNGKRVLLLGWVETPWLPCWQHVYIEDVGSPNTQRETFLK
jgi:hypothetical protein